MSHSVILLAAISLLCTCAVQVFCYKITLPGKLESEIFSQFQFCLYNNYLLNYKNRIDFLIERLRRLADRLFSLYNIKIDKPLGLKNKFKITKTTRICVCVLVFREWACKYVFRIRALWLQVNGVTTSGNEATALSCPVLGVTTLNATRRMVVLQLCAAS